MRLDGATVRPPSIHLENISDMTAHSPPGWSRHTSQDSVVSGFAKTLLEEKWVVAQLKGTTHLGALASLSHKAFSRYEYVLAFLDL